MKYEKDYYTLSTGSCFYAFGGTLGLDPKGNNLYYGYDGEVHENGARALFTPEERQEIADEMISRWQRWAERKE